MFCAAASATALSSSAEHSCARTPITDVMQQPREQGVVGERGLHGQGVRRRRDGLNMRLQFLRVERARTAIAPLGEDFHRRGYVADGGEAEITHRLFDIRDAPGETKESGVDDLEDLRGDSGVRGNELRDVLHGCLVISDQFLQGRVDARERGQLADAPDDAPQGLSIEQLVQQQATVDDILELPEVAGLAQVLVGERDQPDRLPQIGVAGQDDPDRLRPAIADDPQQLRAVHPGHAHIRYDDVVGLPLHLLDGKRAARGAIHRPCAAAAHQAQAQSLERRLLVIHEQQALLHAASLARRPATGSVNEKRVPLPTAL